MNIQWTGRQIFYCISLVSVLCIAFYGYGKITFLKTFDQDRGTSYDCTKEMARLNADKVCQDDARLISAIKRCYMEPPSRLPYNLTNPKREDFSQAGQAKYVDSLLKHSRNRFFVESGAYDGEDLSNSLLFELHRDWTGLLIEPLSQQFNRLRRKNRKSFIINACINKDPYPAQMQLRTIGYFSRIADKNQSPAQKGFETVQCFSFYSILLATGRNRVDFFSLDIEGDELTVLKTIPWNRVDIKTLIVEYNHIKEGKRALVDYMTANGYINVPELNRGGWQDIIFVQNGFDYDRNFIASLSSKHTPRKK